MCAINIGGGYECDNLTIVAKILELMGKKVDESWINFVTDRKGHDLRYSMNSDKIFKELSWSAKTKIEDGLIKTLEWYGV